MILSLSQRSGESGDDEDDQEVFSSGDREAAGIPGEVKEAEERGMSEHVNCSELGDSDVYEDVKAEDKPEKEKSIEEKNSERRGKPRRQRLPEEREGARHPSGGGDETERG
jgi:hypothetical protein